MHNLKKMLFSSAAILTVATSAAPLVQSFAEGDQARPQTELTAGKETDKGKEVSKGEQALTDNSKNEKQSDKESTVLKEEKKKEEPKKDEPAPTKKEEPKKEEPKKLPEAGFETIGLGLLSASGIGFTITKLASFRSKKMNQE